MTNSKLLIYLKTLSNTEMKDFSLYLSISKGAKDSIKLFHCLKKYHPHYTDKALDKNKVAQKLFAEDINKDKKLINAMQRCSRLLDNFLIQEELKTQTENQEMLLLQALKKRRLDTYFFRKADKLDKAWTDNPPPGLLTFHYLFRLKEMVFHHPKYLLQNKKPIKIFELINILDKYLYTVKLFWQLILYNNRVLLSGLEDYIEEKIMFNNWQYAESKGFQNEEPQLYFLNKLSNSFKNNDFSNYDLLKSNFDNHFNLYNQDEKNLITTLFVSACYQNFHEGKPEALRQLFEINRFMVEKNLIIQDSYIQSDQFWNIVNVGFSMKENKWTESFIKQFGEYLPNTEKDDVLSICKAMVSFHNKEFNNALSQIAIVKFQNILYALQARNIQLKCYYELDNKYEGQFWDFTKSFYMFLFRNQYISNGTREEFKNLINFCKELYKIKNNYSNKNIAFKKKLMCNEVKVASKTWLKEKIKEIEESQSYN